MTVETNAKRLDRALNIALVIAVLRLIGAVVLLYFVWKQMTWQVALAMTWCLLEIEAIHINEVTKKINSSKRQLLRDFERELAGMRGYAPQEQQKGV